MCDEESSMSEDFSASEEEWKPTEGAYGGNGGDSSDDDDSDFEGATPKASTSRHSNATKMAKKRNSTKSVESNIRKASKQLVRKRKSAGLSLRDRLYNKYMPPPKTLSTPNISPANSASSSSSLKQSKNLNTPNESDSNPNGHHQENDESSDSEGSICNYLVNAKELDLQSIFTQKKETASNEPPVFDCNAGLNNLSNTESESELTGNAVPNESANSANYFNFQNLLSNLNDYEQALESKKQNNAVNIHSLVSLGEQTNRLQNINKLLDEKVEDEDENYDSNDNGGDAVASNDLPTGSKLHQKKSKRVKRLSKSRPTSSAVNSDSDDSDWEEVAVKEIVAGNTTYNGNLEIRIEMPGAKKHKKTAEEIELSIKRKLNRNLKEKQLLLHKTSLLCRFARTYFYNRLLNDTILMRAALKLLPGQNAYPPEKGTEFKYFEALINWYKNIMKLSATNFYPDKVIATKDAVRQELLQQIANKEVTCRQDFILIFIALVRGMGIQCRLVANMQPLPLKPAQSDLIPIKKKPKDNDDKQTNKAVNRSVKTLKTAAKKTVKRKGKMKTATKGTKLNSTMMSLDGVASSSTNRKAAKDKPPTEEKKNTENHAPGTRSKRTAKNNVEVEPTADLCVKKSNPSDAKKPTSVTKKDNVKEKDSAKTLESQMKLEAEANVGTTTHSKAMLGSLKRQTESKTNNIESTAIKKSKISIKVASIMPSTKHSSKQTAVQQCDINPLTCPTQTTAKTTTLTTRNTRSRSLSNAAHNSVQNNPLQSLMNNNHVESKNSCEMLKQARTTKQTAVIERVSNGIGKFPQMDGADDREMEENAKYFTRKRPNLDRLKSKQPVDVKDVAEASSSEEFQPSIGKKTKPSPPCPQKPAKPSVVSDKRVVSSDEEDELNTSKHYNEKKNDMWIEVWCDVEDQWMCLDIFKNKIHCVESIRKSASRSLAYVFAFQNDLSLKDVTARYCPNWSHTVRKCRVNNDWLATAISLYVGRRTKRDIKENQELRSIHESKPMPTAICDFKNHPLYVLQRHLLKFQAIYPPDCAVLGYIRGEPIYSRDCLYTLHSREIWLKQARVVKMGEKPYKVVKARPKWDRFSNTVLKNLPLDIFGYWQTEDYVPPTAENGIVPRNAYGNVELFKPSMLPKKTVQLRLPGLNRICAKLGVDCAKAVVGFDFHQGACHPTYDGFVVCEEFAETVIDAWHEEQANIERKEFEKYEARVYGNWKRFIRGMITRQRIKLKHNL